MSKSILTRRGFLIGAAAVAGGIALPQLRHVQLPPSYGGLLGLGDTLSYAAHRVLLRHQPLAREFGPEMISKNFPAINTVNPEDEEYQRLLRGGFVDFRLPITGLVERPLSLSVDDLRSFPARTQITQHNCEQGWSAIAEWTGVSLSRVLEHAGMKPSARYVLFRCADGWWDSIDMLDALHPQTLLAYGMNGQAMPIQHGAPVRLRVERQLGYKSLKYVTSVEVTESLHAIEDGTGAMVTSFGYSWYAGI